MNLREIKAQEGFGPSTSSLLDWGSNQLSYRATSASFILLLNIINKMNLREIKAQEGFGPSTSSLLDWRSNQLSYRATSASFIPLLNYH